MAKIEQNAKDTAYRVYVTDSLQMLAKNTAAYAGGGYIDGRFFDLIAPKREDPRTQSEIVEQIRKKIEEVR